MSQHQSWENESYKKEAWEGIVEKELTKNIDEILEDDGMQLRSNDNKRKRQESCKQEDDENKKLKLPAHIRDLLTDKRRFRKRWQNTRCPEAKARFNAIRRQVKQELAECKLHSRDKHIDPFSDGGPSGAGPSVAGPSLTSTAAPIRPLKAPEGTPRTKKQQPALDKIETDPDILQRRQKNIDYGKNTVGYTNYRKMVPIENRTKEHPRTPDKYYKYSRRSWDNLVKLWRKELHAYDPPSNKSKNTNNDSD